MKSTFCFFTSFFTVCVKPSINTCESSTDFMFLMISFVTSFEINEVNPLPVPLPIIVISNLVSELNWLQIQVNYLSGKI